MRSRIAFVATFVGAFASLLLMHETAHAVRGCRGSAGWATGGTTVPPNAHLVYWASTPDWGREPELTAKIAGKEVPARVTVIDKPPYRIILVDIASDATGKLALTWANTGRGEYHPVNLVVKAPPKSAKPKTVGKSLKTRRYSKPRKNESSDGTHDGLEITFDVPAVYANVKVRRDTDAMWADFDVPVVDRSLRIGKIGCQGVFSVGLLENGVEIELDLTLSDGTKVPVDNLSRVSIPRQPGKPPSDNPLFDR